MIVPSLLALAGWDRLAEHALPILLYTGGFCALCLAILVVLRTRIGQSRPILKCAVLSLVVHGLLICVAMTVRLVGGGDSGGLANAPIRVRVIDGDALTVGSLATEPREAMVAPPELMPAPMEASAPSEEAQPVEPEPQPAAVTETVEVEFPAADEVVEAPVEIAPTSVAPSPASNSPPDSTAVAATPIERADATPKAMTPTEQNVSAGGRASPYAGRAAANRLQLVEAQGGSRQTEAAVVMALNWLANAQSADGRWDADRFGAGVERRTLGENRNGAGREADTGITAIALLAFLGAGHTHQVGDYQQTVQHGLEFLLRSQAADGSLFGGAGLYAQMYCHSMATFALAEARALSGDPRLDAGVGRAVAFCVRAQHPTTGGWRYEVGNQGDTSQLGWQTMAIASGERAGVKVPPQTWAGIERFLQGVRRGQFGGLASYQQYSPMTTSMTAEALYCRLMVVDRMGGALDERAAMEATRQVLATSPNARQVNLYYWYYATLALHHRQFANDAAAEAWRNWNDGLVKVLVEGQIRDGANAGSWEPDMEWGGYGGRIYSTALAAMCLEVYYRYLPAAGGNVEVVGRPAEVPTR